MISCTKFLSAFSDFFETTLKATEEYMAGINNIYIRRNEMASQQINPTFILVNQTRPSGIHSKEIKPVIEDETFSTTEPSTEISSESEADSQIENFQDIESAPKTKETQEISQDNKSKFMQNSINELSIVTSKDTPSVFTPGFNEIIPELNDSLSSLVSCLYTDSTDDMPDSSPINKLKVTELPVSQYNNNFTSDEEDSQGIPTEYMPLISASELKSETDNEEVDENIKIIVELSEPTEEEELLLLIQEYAINAFPRFRRSQRIDFVNYLFHDLDSKVPKALINRQVDVMFQYGLLQ